MVEKYLKNLYINRYKHQMIMILRREPDTVSRHGNPTKILNDDPRPIEFAGEYFSFQYNRIKIRDGLR